MKTFIGLVKKTFSEFGEDAALRLSAAMAYYSVFSIGPLLVLIVGLAGLIMNENSVKHQITGQIQSLVGEKSAKMIESMMDANHKSGSLIATIVGGVALLLGAAGVFGQLQDSLNTIFEVKAKPGGGVWGFLRQRFLSMTMILGLGFLLLVSMVLSALVSSMSGQVSHILSMPAWIAQVFNGIISFLVITLLFAMIFKVLPDVKLQWADVWVGAAGTSLLFTAGKFALGYYLGRPSTSSSYGAGAAFILILLYIYYSSVILFLGAEFTQVYARQKRGKLEPKKYAVPVKEQERAEEGMPHDDGKKGSSVSEPGGKGRAKHWEGAPVYAMKDHKPDPNKPGRARELGKIAYAPLERVEARPWSFVGLALATGLATGVLMRHKWLRKGLKAYLGSRGMG